MMTVKDLFENEELMKNIVEDMDEIPESAEVFYAVFALGYTADNEVTSDEVLIGEFTDPDEAIECAKVATLEQIREFGYGEVDPKTVYFSVEVETAVGNPDDEDGGTMNIGTIYKRDLWIDDEYSSEEDAPCSVASVVAITPRDYFLLDDGILRVRNDFLQEYKPDDLVSFYFIDEPDSDMLTYKILSESEYDGESYFDCELMI